MRINVKPIIPIVDMNMIQSLLYMLDGCLNAKNTETPEGVETVFVYCAVWAFGSALTVSDDGTGESVHGCKSAHGCRYLAEEIGG